MFCILVLYYSDNLHRRCRRKYNVLLSSTSVTNMLRELKWSTLEQRRNQSSFTMLHKIHNKQVNVDHSHLTTTRQQIPYSSLKKKTPHELILSAGYTTLERTTDWDFKGCPNCTRICNWTEQVLCLQWTRQFRVSKEINVGCLFKTKVWRNRTVYTV